MVSDEDIISTTSDDVLCHILSFLPIEEVVRTSILSTTWYHIWKLTTNIHLDDTLFCAHNTTQTETTINHRGLQFESSKLHQSSKSSIPYSTWN